MISACAYTISNESVNGICIHTYKSAYCSPLNRLSIYIITLDITRFNVYILKIILFYTHTFVLLNLHLRTKIIFVNDNYFPYAKIKLMK